MLDSSPCQCRIDVAAAPNSNWSSTQSLIASCSRPTKALPPNETLLTLTGHTLALTGAAWSPDNTRLLTISRDGTARVWDATTGERVGWWIEPLSRTTTG
jgi:WD40 repeat protein